MQLCPLQDIAEPQRPVGLIKNLSQQNVISVSSENVCFSLFRLKAIFSTLMLMFTSYFKYFKTRKVCLLSAL